MHLIKSAARPIRPNDLALISMGNYAVLFEVPRGESTLEPKNLLARVSDWSRVYYARYQTSLTRLGRLASTDSTQRIQPVDALPPASRQVVEDLLVAGTSAQTPAVKRRVARWLERGEALKASLQDAGFSSDEMRNLFDYFANALDRYGSRARRITTEAAMQVERNPRRRGVPSVVRVFMPI